MFFQHLSISFFSTPNVCFRTVFTFYVSLPKKKSHRRKCFIRIRFTYTVLLKVFNKPTTENNTK